ncbi:hypothetical protein SAMN04488020_109166 [Palleronia marisminoris]|uniref:hypothetical protein n=1 Tax=Palleronia marisminoris TaxID=315423 RepID=UPI0008E96AEC|nr:hypothetical protein [Palleronia marisminoris]SFH29624.1 hypothetical protein SAMN04488020_109166 [Palleronia marisminoris]
MKSLDRLGSKPASLPLSADDVVEFHAARLLLLFHLCGTANRIDGLTKMAKLDFFVRYPDFFEIARAAVAKQLEDAAPTHQENDSGVESAMVRHHYGPWDKRYYHVLAHLEARRLLDVTRNGKSYRLALTPAGVVAAKTLRERPSFASLAERMRVVKRTFGSKSGNVLKNLIYRLFNDEVGQRELGERIER